MKTTKEERDALRTLLQMRTHGLTPEAAIELLDDLAELEAENERLRKRVDELEWNLMDAADQAEMR